MKKDQNKLNRFKRYLALVLATASMAIQIIISIPMVASALTCPTGQNQYQGNCYNNPTAVSYTCPVGSPSGVTNCAYPATASTGTSTGTGYLYPAKYAPAFFSQFGGVQTATPLLSTALQADDGVTAIIDDSGYQANAPPYYEFQRLTNQIPAGATVTGVKFQWKITSGDYQQDNFTITSTPAGDYTLAHIIESDPYYGYQTSDTPYWKADPNGAYKIDATNPTTPTGPYAKDLDTLLASLPAGTSMSAYLVQNPQPTHLGDFMGALPTTTIAQWDYMNWIPNQPAATIAAAGTWDNTNPVPGATGLGKGMSTWVAPTEAELRNNLIQMTYDFWSNGVGSKSFDYLRFAVSYSVSAPITYSCPSGGTPDPATNTCVTAATVNCGSGTNISGTCYSLVGPANPDGAVTKTGNLPDQVYTATIGIAPLNTAAAFGNNGQCTGGITYALTPSLPAGLIFDANTGQISGTATSATAIATYTVTATCAPSGSTASASFNITVNPPPGNIASKGTGSIPDIAGQTGTVIAPINAASGFTENGQCGSVTYSVSPALPAGLTLNSATGMISGTPTSYQTKLMYTVTATCISTGVTATNTLGITIAPSGVISANGKAIPGFNAVEGTTITPIDTSVAFTSSGCLSVSYDVSPALPAGLSINTSTGVITGSNTALSPQTIYTVTATCVKTDGSKVTATSTIGGIAYTLPKAMAESLDCSAGLRGYILDSAKNTGGTSYKVYVDGDSGTGKLVGTFTTDVARADILAANPGYSGNVGFLLSVAKLQTGLTGVVLTDGAAHTVSIYAVSAANGSETLATQSGLALRCCPSPGNNKVDLIPSTDCDGDGMTNSVEGYDINNDGSPADAIDTDKDGIPDYLDTDSDNDGIPDRTENWTCTPNAITCAAIDTNNNGTPNFRDLDSDGDGKPDTAEKGPNCTSLTNCVLQDTDGDGTPDVYDAWDTDPCKPNASSPACKPVAVPKVPKTGNYIPAIVLSALAISAIGLMGWEVNRSRVSKKKSER